MESKYRVLLGDLGILFVAVVWGTANAVISVAIEDITPYWFCGLRFAIAFAVVSAAFGKRALALPWRTRVAGTLIGAVFIGAYLTGAVALLYTTSGNVSFIVSMSVAFVPLAVWILTKKFPGSHIVMAVALCTAGMAGLMLDDKFTVNVGDLLCFGSMLCVTAYIILVQRFVRSADPYGLACWQAFGGMLLSLACALALEPFPAGVSAKSWIAIVYTATIGFALTIVIQNVAQKYTSATHAAILLSTSGVFGRAIGVIFLGEPLTPRIFISSALILAGVLLAEAVPALRGKTVASAHPRKGTQSP